MTPDDIIRAAIARDLASQQAQLDRCKRPRLGGKLRKRMDQCFNCGAPNRGTECFYCGELPDPRWYEVEVGYPEPANRIELVAELVRKGILEPDSAREMLDIP